MAKLIALDFGKVRTGIAVTDDLQLIASGLTTVPTKDLLAFLKEYLATNVVDGIVVGEPKQMNGMPSEAEALIQPFLKKLTHEFPDLKVVRQDERFTSKMAVNSMLTSGMKKKKRQNKAEVDVISATLILQSFLDRPKIMILPIVAYGDPVLRKKAKNIPEDYPKFKDLVSNMFDTMYNASGVGLAGPQVGLPLRIFVIDATPFSEDDDLTSAEKEQLKSFKKVFINAVIDEETGEEWPFNEGCLSIPDVREDVNRKPTITITYQDENFKTHTETYDGLAARIIQHEYDHIEGILFTDKLSSLKKRLLKSRLEKISKGKIGVDYKMRFPNLKKDDSSFTLKKILNLRAQKIVE